MKRPLAKLSCVLACSLVVTSGLAAQSGQADQPSPDIAVQPSKQTAAQLQQVVAPIALYPDNLVAQILAASTYPDDIVEADRWLQQQTDLKGDQLAQEADKQPWDPAVKALTAFPAILGNMDRNLSWTSTLGDAYVNQQQDVMTAVQAMRQLAKNAGNLQSNAQQKVSTEGKTIVIEPANTEMVYVPQYDPWMVYGAPIGPWPGWYPYPGLFWDSPGIGFGLGFGVGFLGGFGWGWSHWGTDWRHAAVDYNHNAYMSRSRSIANRRALASRPGGAFGRASVAHTAGAFRGGDHAASRSGAFGGFNHGAVTSGFGARGRASMGGMHAGGFHGGGRR
jgi:hypothetical protein